MSAAQPAASAVPVAPIWRVRWTVGDRCLAFLLWLSFLVTLYLASFPVADPA